MSDTNEIETSAFEDAQQAKKLRDKFRDYAYGAVSHGHVARAWINGRLAAFGIAPLQGASEYRMNVPITGAFGWRIKANSRAEAMEQFQRQITRVIGAGKITADGSYDNVYQLKVVGEPTFYAGPEDTEVADPAEMDLAGLKTAIRDLLKEGVTTQNWGHSHAVQAAEDLGLEPLPSLVYKTVEVPVVGTYTVQVRAFADADDAEVSKTVVAAIGTKKIGGVQVDEIGTAHVKADEEDAEDEPENDDVF